MDNDKNEPDAVGTDLRSVRERLDREHDALRDPATRTRLVRDGYGARYAPRPRRGSAQDTADALSYRAKAAPIALAMAAIGVAGLLASRRPRPFGQDSYENNDYRMRVGPNPASRRDGTLDTLKDQASDLRDNVSETVGDLREQAGEVVGDLRETAADYADSAYRSGVAGYKVARNRAAHLARNAPEQGERVASQTGTWVRENPFPVSLAVLAVGAVAASFLTYRGRDEEHDDYPRTRQTGVRVDRIVPNTAAETTATRGDVKPSSPDVSSAIPAGKSKLGENVVESTSVLGVAENEKKS